MRSNTCLFATRLTPEACSLKPVACLLPANQLLTSAGSPNPCLNPVTAGVFYTAEDYKYSSAGSHAGG